MDVQQLKLLAGRIRGLLEQQNHNISHNQALDTSAALPGLRNWPEVMAFPDRVAACQLNAVATQRLSHRLRKRFSAEFSPETLLEAFRPPEASPEASPTEIWPSGAAPGVYVTTSQNAINALLVAYEDATDGALVYAEEAGSHHDGTIDLGENGLSSPGLTRVPSGTLVVVGPMELNQQAWENNANHLEWACMRALHSGHRVALLVDTPTPETIFQDLELMVRSMQQEGDQFETMLRGTVTESGDLATRSPVAAGTAHPIVLPDTATLYAIPASALLPLQAAIDRRPRGILVLGSSVIEEHWAIDLICAALALTKDLGPAARIMARKRGTPAKDMMVPDPVKALPVMSSIDSAYAHGYRRMLVQSIYTRVEDLQKYAKDVTFIVGTHGFEANEALMNMDRGGFVMGSAKYMDLLIAVLGVAALEGKRGAERIADLYTPGDRVFPEKMRFSEAEEIVLADRLVRWEDQLEESLANKTLTLASVKAALSGMSGRKGLASYLADRSKRAASSAR